MYLEIFLADFAVFCDHAKYQKACLEGTLLTELGGDLLSHYLDSFQLGGTFGRNFGVVNWIPSKWEMFRGHIGDFNCISSNWGTFGEDTGNVN